MKKSLEFLKKAHSKNRLTHLYIFSGDAGTGKKELSLNLAEIILKPYDKSTNFKQNIENLTHPQVHYIKPEGSTIKKAQIIDLQTEFSKTSLIDGPRIYIIEDIDLISSSAANSLLKFMEEPESSLVYGILLTTNIGNVLPTIISRAQTIKLNALNKTTFINYLMDNEVEERVATNLAYITNSVEEALIIKDNEVFIQIIEFLEEMIDKWNDPTYSINLKVFDKLEILSYDRKNYQMFLELMLVYFLDIIHYKTHQNLIFEYLRPNIQKASQVITVKQLEAITTAIQNEIINQTYYINISLSLNALIIVLEKGRF